MLICDGSSDVCSSDLLGWIGMGNSPPARKLAVSPDSAVKLGWESVVTVPSCSRRSIAAPMLMPSNFLSMNAVAPAPRIMRVPLGAPSVGVSSEKRSEEHTSELQSLMRISYAVFCLKKKQSKIYNN